MATFALIFADSVAQIASETFPVAAGLAWADVSAVSPAPAAGWAAAQSDGAWTFTGPAVATPTLAEQAQAALAAGLTITSASTPAIDGTYSCSAAAQANITSVMVFTVFHSAFPNAATSYPWVDTSGTPHDFPTVALFQAFATAVANYVSALTLIALSNTGTLPASTAPIA